MATATRSKKPDKCYSEEELEIVSHRLRDKEQQLHAEAEAIRLEREDFMREREIAARHQEQFEASMKEKEIEMARREVPHSMASIPALTPDNLINEILILRQEVNSLRAETTFPPTRRHSANGSHSFAPPDEGSDGPRISFRDALETVPHFDGMNITLSQFSRACRRARDIIPPSSEKNLVRLLINKLRGRAYFAVEDEPCDTVAHLIDLLNAAFGTSKTIDQCRGELSTIFMKPTEHMLEYIIRVKDLRCEILDCERRSRGLVSPQATVEIDALTARSFCDGLPRDYRYWLRPEHFVKPFDAFGFAKSLAKRRELEDERENSFRQRETRNTRGDSLQHMGRPIAQSTPRRLGIIPDRPFGYPNRSLNQHRLSAIPSDPFRGIRSRGGDTTNDRYRPPERRNGEEKICRYCKNRGHDITECRKREYNNSRNTQGNFSRPSGNQDAPRATARDAPMRPIQAMEPEQPTTSGSPS